MDIMGMGFLFYEIIESLHNILYIKPEVEYVAQLVEHLTSMHKAPGSVATTT